MKIVDKLKSGRKVIDDFIKKNQLAKPFHSTGWAAVFLANFLTKQRRENPSSWILCFPDETITERRMTIEMMLQFHIMRIVCILTARNVENNLYTWLQPKCQTNKCHRLWHLWHANHKLKRTSQRLWRKGKRKRNEDERVFRFYDEMEAKKRMKPQTALRKWWSIVNTTCM